MLVAQVCQAVRALRVRILGDEELSEEVKAIPSRCMGPEVRNETVRSLLFCFDGPHRLLPFRISLGCVV